MGIQVTDVFFVRKLVGGRLELDLSHSDWGEAAFGLFDVGDVFETILVLKNCVQVAALLGQGSQKSLRVVRLLVFFHPLLFNIRLITPIFQFSLDLKVIVIFHPLIQWAFVK